MASNWSQTHPTRSRTDRILTVLIIIFLVIAVAEIGLIRTWFSGNAAAEPPAGPTLVASAAPPTATPTDQPTATATATSRPPLIVTMTSTAPAPAATSTLISTATQTATAQPTATNTSQPAVTNAPPTTRTTTTPVPPTSTPTKTATSRPANTPTATATATPKPDTWRGEYFDNRTLAGSPDLVRYDDSLNFNWGMNAPATGVPADNFSARWTRAFPFEAATYRFHVHVDDGARLWVGDRLVIDEWRDGSYRELTADYAVATGDHTVRVEYYDSGLDARITVWWEKLLPPTNTPTPRPSLTPTATATAQPSATPTATATARPSDTPAPTATPTATSTPLPGLTPMPVTPVVTAPPPKPTWTPTPTLSPTPLPMPPLRINELLAVPLPLTDEQADIAPYAADEWIELYNGGKKNVNMGGWTIVIIGSEKAYKIPGGTLLKPGQFLVLYSEKTGIKLPNNGGKVRLLDKDGKVIDGVNYPALPPGASASRDETGRWHNHWPPTPGRPNLPPSAAPGALKWGQPALR